MENNDSSLSKKNIDNEIMEIPISGDNHAQNICIDNYKIENADGNHSLVTAFNNKVEQHEESSKHTTPIKLKTLLDCPMDETSDKVLPLSKVIDANTVEKRNVDIIEKASNTNAVDPLQVGGKIHISKSTNIINRYINDASRNDNVPFSADNCATENQMCDNSAELDDHAKSANLVIDGQSGVTDKDINPVQFDDHVHESHIKGLHDTNYDQSKKASDEVKSLDTKAEIHLSQITFPDNIQILYGNYAYANDGTLRNIVDKAQFKFTNQAEYEKLADSVLTYCQNLLDTELERRIDASPELDGCPIWVSKDIAEKNKFLLLIQGSGRVRAGVWGCSLCINAENGISKGTMLGYIKKAKEMGYGVIVANPNENIKEMDPDDDPIFYKNSESGTKHCITIYETVLKPLLMNVPFTQDRETMSSYVDILAHSNGGYCTMGLLKHLADKEDEKSLKAFRKIGLTDSVHSGTQVREQLLKNEKFGNYFTKWFKDRTRVVNFVPSPKKFGTELKGWGGMKPIICLSCENTDHASTNYASEDALFRWLDEQPLED